MPETTKPEPNATELRRRKRLTAALAGGIVLGMTGLAAAAVPIYQWFCQVTGFGGTTQRTDALAGAVLDRVVTVRFDANVASALGWDFRPEQNAVVVRVGEPVEVAFLATNTTGHASSGSAIFNVTPETTGAYFMKVECFCFTEQTLAAGETVRMPVLFYIDPAIAGDANLNYVDTITLSYSFNAVTRAETAPVARTSVGGDG